MTTLTTKDLTCELQDMIDTVGAIYVEDAVRVLASDGLPALEAMRAAANPSRSPLLCAVLDLAIVCAKWPAPEWNKSYVRPMGVTPPTLES
jgi:hypothetical protein